MDDEGKRDARPAFERGVALATSVILAEATKTPREIQEGLEAGKLVMRDFPYGRVYLESGGVVIAEGRIVRRRGQNYLRVRKVYRERMQEAGL